VAEPKRYNIKCMLPHTQQTHNTAVLHMHSRCLGSSSRSQAADKPPPTRPLRRSYKMADSWGSNAADSNCVVGWASRTGCWSNVNEI